MKQESKFVRVVCVRCGAKHIIFGKASSRIKCYKCNKLLAEVTGGKIKIKTLVKEVLR